MCRYDQFQFFYNSSFLIDILIQFWLYIKQPQISNLILVCATKETWNRRNNFDPGQHCIFPFKYKGIEYSECTDVDSEKHGKSYFWCATKVNEDKEIVEGGRNWGECNDNCRRHGTLKVVL